MTATERPRARPIRLTGCRQHNLKGFDIEIPRGQYVVVTGVSGSGKSSLAFDTLFAEGQRRYVESFSAYARQFLERMNRPAIDGVDGIPPAVAIEQGNSVRSSRSTVGTVTEIHDYVKVLFARGGVRHCDRCERPVRRASPESVADALLAELEGGRAVVGFERDGAGAEGWPELRDALRREGFLRVVVDGRVERLDAVDAHAADRVTVALDRVTLQPGRRSRLVDALEQAFAHGRGAVVVHEVAADGVLAPEPRRYDRTLRCPHCDLAHADPTPGLFTFNNPIGACPECKGFGRTIEIHPDLVVPDQRLSLARGAIKPWSTEKTHWERRALKRFAGQRGVPLDVPYSDLDPDDRRWLWEGEPGGFSEDRWWGIDGWFRWLESKVYKLHVRVLLARYRAYVPCTACGGTRFRPEALRTRLGERTIAELYRLPIGELRAFFDALELGSALAEGTAPLMEEVRSRLAYLGEVGLDYLTLDRGSRTLSGGEMQRVNLTTAVGSSLTNALFVLDEPSVGLHPRDNERLIGILRRLVANGNTALVVEHDPALIEAAEHLVDMGPVAGEGGGRVLYEGPVAGVRAIEESSTGRYLAGELEIPLPAERRRLDPEHALVVRGARAHNLADIDVRFPLGGLVCVTGVSGSGKSSLVDEVLHRNLLRTRGKAAEDPGECAAVEGEERIGDIVFVDATPIGRSPKSTVATYLKVYGRIRALIAATPEAREAGITATSLSFNTPGGRCETCEGAGFEKVEMQFLADVHVPCAECGGARFQPEALAVRFGGLNVGEILDLSLEDAVRFFDGDAKLVERLEPTIAVGLGYLRLGQSVVALSGGEAQRLKLAAALASSKSARGNLYLFDEPSTGLAAADLGPLARAFDLLVEAGHSLIVIEHNGEIIKRADHVIDLGPEAGAAGGRVVAEGTPEAVAECAASMTGRYLAPLLEGHRDGAVAVDAGLAVSSRVAEPPPERYGPPLIRVEGAHEHNLRSVSLELPQGRFIVVTGPSGSGKSSLAFDILFAEGQRRYLETLSPYARQFLAPVSKPEVDRVDGLPPAIAIEQRRTRGGSKTTVATLTEIWHYLRLLWSRLGEPHCPGCDTALTAGTPKRITSEIVRRFGGQRVRLLAPVLRGRKGFHREVFEKLAREGVKLARVDGAFLDTEPTPELERYREHDIEAVVATVAVGKRATRALEATVAGALERGAGAIVAVGRGGAEAAFSTELLCPRCGTGVPEPEPRSFSFVSPRGWCPECQGYGAYADVCDELLVPDASLSLAEGALPVLDGEPFSKRARARFAKQVADALGVAGDVPWSTIPKRKRRAILEGASGFDGLKERLRRFLDDGDRAANLQRFLTELPCAACDGARLRPESRAVRVAETTLPQVAAMTVVEARAWVDGLAFGGVAGAVLAPIRRELEPKLRFLEDVGLGYLTLDRRGDTLSGGEGQRIRLAASLGSHLTGVLYVLDEPTIGLHPVDSGRLIGTLERLRDLGNTVVVVEHDEDTIRAADLLVDLGPGAGKEGGQIVAMGSPRAVARKKGSRTAASLRGEGRGRRNERARPRPGEGHWLTVRGAAENNLREVDASLPLGTLTCVTGVSGSGKSTLVRDVLFQALRRRISQVPVVAGRHAGIDGAEGVERVAEVDQAPIGRNPRSTPGTYTGIWDAIRKLFAATAESRARGYGPGRFSFNVRGGRCEKCEGQGVLKLEMSFLPDARVRCDACDGRRFNGETLEVRFKGKSIADVLDMTAEEGVAFFEAHPAIRDPLALMCRVDLAYLTLGQASPTLSGGEAQRIKLVEELGKPSSRRSLFVLDEPTTGLSIGDVGSLIEVLHLLVERGDTVVVIEHHMDVIAEADWVIDLGPGGGSEGGEVVAAGAPRDLAKGAKGKHRRSATSRYLREWFDAWGDAKRR